MSEQELLRVCELVKGGGQLFIGADPMGRRKIKVVRGPFGIKTERFSCSERDVQRLRALLFKKPDKAA
jgi:hypothetical protein